MKIKNYLLSALLLVMAVACTPDKKLQSPDGSATFEMRIAEDGAPTFDITVDGVTVLANSVMGYTNEEGTIGDQTWKVGKIVKESHDGIWEPLWGKRAKVEDKYNQMSVSLEKGEDVIVYEVRAYNDGVAWRIVDQSGAQTLTEVSNFNFGGDYTAWFYNGERHNIGPELLSESNGERWPIMTVKANENLYLAVHEACVYRGKPLMLKKEAGNTCYEVVSEPTAIEAGDAMAWRLVMFGRKPGDLVDSHVIELLNPEAEGDFSWVRPGVNLWDWRIDGAIWEDYHYGMNYDSWVRMVDFAARNGFSALVLDANWYGPEFDSGSDPVKGDKARDVQNIIKYGKEKGVGLWLYLNDVAGRKYPLEATLEQYESWGAAGVKYGFMVGTPTEKNQKTIEITQLCAKHHLCVDFHDYPVHPWGQARTYPNAITREYCKAQLDGHDIFYPKTFVTSCFVNMVAGPIDQNNGFFDLRQGRTTRVDNNQEVPSTVAAEAARTFITYSGATVIPDIPEYYELHPELLEFIASEKQPWLESKTLDGVIDEYIVMMRQANDGRFLVAAATNEEARTLTVDLGFLPEGKYLAKITEDADDAHYMTNREVTKHIEIEVDAKSTLELQMAPGGGACVLFEKQKDK